MYVYIEKERVRGRFMFLLSKICQSRLKIDASDKISLPSN